MMKQYIRLGFFLAIFLGLVGCSSSSGKAEFSYFPKLAKPEHLYVIEKASLSPEQFVMISTLQGVLAQNKPEIYINDTGPYNGWLEDIKSGYGVTTEEIGDAWELITKFKDRLKGFIVYENHLPSINVATSLAGLWQGIAVEKSLVSQVEALGLTQLEDVSDKDDSWLILEHGSEFSKKLIVQQDTEKGELRDIGVAYKAMYIFSSSSAITELPAVFDALDTDAVRLGWGPGDEFSHVGLASLQGVGTIATDWAVNLTTLSGIERKAPFKQPKQPKIGPADPKAHYVAFVMSDGDNVQWLLNDFTTSDRYFGSPDRGSFPMGWQLAPTLADLAPSVLSWIYDYAAETDNFVGGVSGTSYFYPGDYPPDALKANAEHLDAYLRKTDMRITTILERSNPSTEVLKAYASAKHLDGAILLYGEKYVGPGGKVHWVDGKPFVGIRETLWSTDPVAMANRINGYETDPTKAEGYTIVNVHPWSHTMADVKKVVDNLDGHVKIVTPQELIDRIRRDVVDKTGE
ncbi:GxGYxYP domain-containing protein [Paenibacillus sp. GCM10012307]|uniref:GxGYxY sequence motif-containing protein n=1 Tax=Paenibacillus roseus TaxID=2798579 RepID=A0A934J666_9BACL|nr:GxGYxYP domain-containing protein [Paenibacillus roseus]MBJ6362464.1 hypothetical protein [Paenibacillus roseus]